MKMKILKKVMLISIFAFTVIPINAKKSSAKIDSLIRVLDAEIAKREYYQNQKENRIDSLKKELNISQNKISEYILLSKIADEYTSFIYDSAFVYTRKTYEKALELNDPSKEVDAKLQMAFVLNSSGMFTEAKDLLQSIYTKDITQEQRERYYDYVARMYFDLSVYADDGYFSEMYKGKGVACLDSLAACVTEAKKKSLAIAQRELRAGDFSMSIAHFESVLALASPSDKNYALVTSSLGFLYSLKAEEEKSLVFLIEAACADIRHVTKETVALREIAENINDLKHRDKYIQIAEEDAKFYNARQRMAQIGAVAAEIKQEKILLVEQQRNTYIHFMIILGVLGIVALALFLVSIFQYRKLSETRRSILENNYALQKANAKLQETNRIKEEYIGYFFRMNSDYIQKQELLQKKISELIQTQDYSKLKTLVTTKDLDSQRTELYHIFDKIFLKIFPTFIDEFNQLFNPEDRIRLSNSELMNTDLRIFALIRLGIKDNEDIAEFLNYSVNTIYTYKTKIKNKSIVDNEDFEGCIMKIKAV